MSTVSSFIRKSSLVIVCCLAIIIAGRAQSTDPGVLGKVTISSPNAAALGKYIDIPVNNHTGIPQISIPIYSLSEGPLSLPVSLSYHASGLRLEELASWVGAGWSLNAGGVITRTVRGTPDECLVSEFSKNEKGSLGHNGYNNYIFKWDQDSPLPTEDVAFHNNFGWGIEDGEPDLFFFNFNGHNGKFYFNDDGRPVLLPESDYKIEYVYEHATGSGSPESIAKFIVTTSDGTRYYFGRTDASNDVDPIEKTHNYYTGPDLLFYTGTNNTISSWFLNKIVSADGLFSITLNYAAEQYSYRSIFGKNRVSYEFTNITSGNWDEMGHWVQGVRLSSITVSSNNVVITFNPGDARQDLNEWTSAATLSDAVNTDSKRLGAIQISNNSGLCKKFILNHSYFVSDPAGFPGTLAFTDQKRLRLDQVKEESCDGTTVVPPHIFEYFSEPLPRRLSFAKDHWGFMNGKTENLQLIPSYTEKAEPTGAIKEIAGADRDPYWPAMRAGSLKKITYPTGGYTDFEFEANTTFVNYNTYTKTTALYFGMGFDCNSAPVYQTFNFSGNPYSVKLINSNAGGTAYFNNTSGSLYIQAEEGETIFSQAVVGAGTQQVWISKPGTFNCNGAAATIYEWIPTTVSENKMVGGLRIKKITHNDGIGTPDLVTEYDYNEPNGHSSGHLYSRPTYAQFIRNDFLKDAGMYVSDQPGVPYCSPEGYLNCPTSSGPASGGYLLSPNSIRPMETTQGNHLGYNEVKVYSAGNGHSIYRYYGSNVWDQVTDDVANRVIRTGYPSILPPNFPGAPPVTDFKRGEIKYEGSFNQNSQLLKEAYYYHDFTENPLKTPALIVGSAIGWAGLPTYYELSTSKRTKLTIQERIFQTGGGNSEIVTEKYFNSPFHNQVTKKTETNSNGEMIETLYKYSGDFIPINCTSIDNGLTTYQNSCSSCLAQYNQDRISQGHNTAFWKYWDYHALLKCRSLARISFFNARKNYYNPSVSGSYANCLVNAKAAANTDLKPLFELQDRFIITPIEVAVKKGGNLAGSVFTKFDYSLTVPGMVYPVKTQKINLASLSSTFTEVAINGNGLVKDSRYIDETDVIIANGNVSEVKGKDGVTTSYIWGYNNTLPIVKAVGVTAATLQSAYNAVSGNLSLLRTQPSLSSAFINTYVYTPGIGITSETDTRGRTIYYEYDKLNRLIFIRDHDNKIIKKICYNYAGQVENCVTNCTNTNPDWQNTSTPPTCQQGGCGNTGYIQQEQQDINPCSPTYNQTQTILIYDPNSCPASGVTITYQNETPMTGFVALYTNNSTGQTYSFNVPASGSGSLGCVPAGIYSLSISKPGNSMWTLFGTGCFTQSGTSAFFGKVNVSSCNTVIIGYDY